MLTNLISADWLVFFRFWFLCFFFATVSLESILFCICNMPSFFLDRLISSISLPYESICSILKISIGFNFADFGLKLYEYIVMTATYLGSHILATFLHSRRKDSLVYNTKRNFIILEIQRNMKLERTLTRRTHKTNVGCVVMQIFLDDFTATLLRSFLKSWFNVGTTIFLIF